MKKDTKEMATDSLSGKASKQITAGVGYLELLRKNRDFRNLWLGQVVSEIGDWFSTIALLSLLLELTGRAQAVAWFWIIIHIPAVMMGPLGGVIVDRLDRKWIMVCMDLFRGVIVLGYLLVREADQAWLLYTIAATEVALMSIFEPARTATVPNICERHELVSANALSSVTWSTMLTIGAALGGFAAAAFGRDVCFVFNSVSFFFSALFIRAVRIDSNRRAHGRHRQRILDLAGLYDGLRYVQSHPSVLALMLIKTGWGLGGGIWLILSLFGERIFPIGGSADAGIGFLFAARGFGNALGPIIARRFSRGRHAEMRKSIAFGFFLCCVCYIVFGQVPWLSLAALAVIFAHMGASITWVFSTVLLQIAVPDEVRGRVFAVEFAGFTLAVAISNCLTGYCLDNVHLDPRTVATLLGLYFLIPGSTWLAAQGIFRVPGK